MSNAPRHEMPTDTATPHIVRLFPRLELNVREVIRVGSDLVTHVVVVYDWVVARDTSESHCLLAQHGCRVQKFEDLVIG